MENMDDLRPCPFCGTRRDYTMLKIENTVVFGWEAAIRGFTEYKVTKDGQVIGKRGKPMKGHIDRCGYREVVLSYYPHRQIQALVHRLVLSTFAPIDNMELYDVNHKNGDKLTIVWKILSGVPVRRTLNTHIKINFKIKSPTLMVLIGC